MKKGALELSITAIVVLIIAITVLGFSIFFIKSLFGTGQEILEGEITKVKDKLKDDFASEGKSVGINVGTDIRLASGKPKQVFIGIKNSEAKRVCYGIRLQCLGSTGETTSCQTEIPPPSNVVGGLQPDEVWFQKLFASIALEPNDVAVLPTNIQIPTKYGKETFNMRLEVAKEVTGPDDPPGGTQNALDGLCQDLESDYLDALDGSTDGIAEVHATLPFFITVE
ncbi:MAG: hypothetical protein QGH82_04580 [Candidatus Woesearchaeota archaeon]|nr:hypothetical protein [Candidatus Woesearchaeota archaeon]